MRMKGSFHVFVGDDVDWKALPARKIIFFNPPYRSLDDARGISLAVDEGIHTLSLFFRSLRSFLKLQSFHGEDALSYEGARQSCFLELQQVSDTFMFFFSSPAC